MVKLDELAAKYLPSGTVLFPAYRSLPDHTHYITSNFANPATPLPPTEDDPLGWLTITAPLHSSFHAQWPVPVDVPLALRGFRHALGLSQAKFADRLRQGRLNIERWETGKRRPFRGHSLSLLHMLRPLVNGP